MPSDIRCFTSCSVFFFFFFVVLVMQKRAQTASWIPSIDVCLQLHVLLRWDLSIQAHHLTIFRNIVHPALHRPSSESVAMYVSTQNSVWLWYWWWLHSLLSTSAGGYGSFPNVMFYVQLDLDVCASDVRESWHTKEFWSIPPQILVVCCSTFLSESKFPSDRLRSL